MRRTRSIVLFVAGVVLYRPHAFGQAFGPAGVEKPVNTTTAGDQHDATAAEDVIGNSLVFWSSSAQDSGTSGIYGRRFNLDGPVGDEFRVNTHTTGDQVHPRAGVGNGNYVVVWEDDGGADGNGSGIYGQRYDVNGQPKGSEFRVNVFTTGDQTNPAVAADGAGNFVVVWSGPGSGDSDGIFSRGFSSTGAPVSGDLRINSYTTGVQASPAVAMPVGAGFSYLVVWASSDQDGTSSLFAQRADLTTGLLGSEFRVNTTTGADQDQPAIATSPNANGHAIVWRKSTGASSADVVARRYDALLAPLGTEFTVNPSAGTHDHPSAVMDGSKNLFVVWTAHDGEDGSGDGILGRRFPALSAPGSAFKVNTYTAGSQTEPHIAGFTLGQYRVVWSSASQDGSGQGVYTQLYCNWIVGDANDDHVVNVSDVFYLINYLFSYGPLPLNGSDVNGDTKVDVADVFYLINFLFTGGPAPGCQI